MVSVTFLLAVVWGSVLVVAASTVLAWRQRPRPGATAFAVAMLAATWWVATSALGLFTTDPDLRVFWATVEWAGVVAFPVAWFVFALAYTGRGKWVTPRRVGALALVPALTLALALTNGVGHRLLYRSTTFEAFGTVSLLSRTFGPWFWVHATYSTALLLAGTTLVVRLAAQRRPLYRGQATALVLVVAAPLVGSAIYVSGLSPVPGFDPTPYTFVVSGAAGLAALSQFSFLDAVPVTNRVARRSVVENVDAGVLVADTTGHVVDANPRVADLLDVADPTGDSVETLLPGRVDDGATTRRPDGERCPGDEDVIAVERGHRTRYYEVDETALTDEYGALTGRIFLVRDVTERRARLQRLNVLNRVLRHNLRNEMNVVYGLADSLEHGDADPGAVAAEVREKADDLVALSDRAREADELLTERDRPAADVSRVVRIECERVAEAFPGTEVRHDTLADDAPVDAAAGTVVSNLVENAAQHNDAEAPAVEVSVTRDGDRVTVSVADNGPGIPSQERSALQADLETQLDHASGLGLWLANWAATAAGGNLAIEDRDGGGTVVTVTVPVAGSPTDADGSSTPRVAGTGRDGSECDGPT